MTIAYPNNQALQTPLPVSPPSGAQRPRLTFLGTGYLGATYAVCFAEMGYEVLGLDPDEPILQFYGFTTGWARDGVSLTLRVRCRGLAPSKRGGYFLTGWGASYDVIKKRLKPDDQQLGELRWE